MISGYTNKKTKSIYPLDETKTEVSVGNTTIYQLVILNATAAIAYLQIFNKLIADVTVGTTTPDIVIPVGPDVGGGGETLAITFGEMGIPLGVGMVVASTTTATGNTGANQDMLIVYG